MVGSWWLMGAWGASRGELGGAGEVLDRRWGLQRHQDLSIEQTACSCECICSLSCGSVCWAVFHCCTSLMAWGWISGVTVVVWVLDVTVVVIFWLFSSGVVAIVDDDMVLAVCGSGVGTGEGGTSWGQLGDMGRPLDCCLEFLGGQGRSIE